MCFEEWFLFAREKSDIFGEKLGANINYSNILPFILPLDAIQRLDWYVLAFCSTITFDVTMFLILSLPFLLSIIDKS